MNKTEDYSYLKKPKQNPDKRKSFLLKMDNDLHRELSTVADKQGRTMTIIMNKLLTDYLMDMKLIK